MGNTPAPGVHESRAVAFKIGRRLPVPLLRHPWIAITRGLRLRTPPLTRRATSRVLGPNESAALRQSSPVSLFDRRSLRPRLKGQVRRCGRDSSWPPRTDDAGANHRIWPITRGSLRQAVMLGLYSFSDRPLTLPVLTSLVGSSLAAYAGPGRRADGASPKFLVSPAPAVHLHEPIWAPFAVVDRRCSRKSGVMCASQLQIQHLLRGWGRLRTLIWLGALMALFLAVLNNARRMLHRLGPGLISGPKDDVNSLARDPGGRLGCTAVGRVSLGDRIHTARRRAPSY